jgi:uncharacterized protein YlbG (UPF0298 family)
MSNRKVLIQIKDNNTESLERFGEVKLISKSMNIYSMDLNDADIENIKKTIDCIVEEEYKGYLCE